VSFAGRSKQGQKITAMILLAALKSFSFGEKVAE